MSVDFGWRRFNFFDKNIVLDPQNADSKFLGLKDVCVDCWSSDEDFAYLGESRGGVFRLSRHLDECYWKAYQHSLADVCIAKGTLFSVGEDEDDESSGSLIKQWDSAVEGEPVLKRTVRLAQIAPANTAAATSLAVHSHLTDVAVGFADGTVVLYQGDVVKDRASRWLRVREATPLEGPVTGLALAQLPGSRLVVFVITTKTVYSYVIENKTVNNKLKHDANGASRDCWTFDERLGQLVVASRDMVYLHDAERCVEADGGRGRCFQLGRGHEKLQLVASGEHLVLLTKQQALIPSSETEFMSMVTVYDVKGQYIAFSCSLPSLCRIFIVGGSLMILGKDGTLSELSEKNLSAKLDILFKKNLYDVAVGLAKASRDGKEHLKSIHAKYGDYLYGKGDFDNAISQYKETIGMLQPSYVIKRFHEDTRLRQLCIYLSALHESKQQNGHHTAILLQCYARLGEKKKMLAFIEGMKNATEEDMNVAFQVLRTSKMSMEASILATKLQRHEDALTMMVEDLGKYQMAIKYISNRPPTEACVHIEKYGRILFEKFPDETMTLLLGLLKNSNESEIDPVRLLGVFLGDSSKSAEFIEFALKKVSDDRRIDLLDTVLELHLRAYADPQNTADRDECAAHMLSLLEGGRSNTDRILQLAQLFDCSPVVECLLKKANRKEELMQHYMKKGKLDDVISLCISGADKNMWLDALVFVSKIEGEVDERAVHRLLQSIEAAQSVHPLVVLDILSRSSCLKVSAVREYIINWLQKQEAQIETDKQSIGKSEQRMEEIDKKIESLKFNVQVLQVNKCCACDTALQLPAVHFLCRHSYHVHCFESYSDRSDKCPACTPALPTFADSENLNDRDAYSKFQKELNSSVNAMDLIAKYLRMGLFDAPKPTKKKSIGSPSPHGSLNPFEDASDDVNLNPFDVPTPKKERRPSGQRTKTRTATAYEEEKNPFSTKSASLNPFDE